MSVKQKRHWHVSLCFFIPSLLVSVAECGGQGRVRSFSFSVSSSLAFLYFLLHISVVARFSFVVFALYVCVFGFVALVLHGDIYIYQNCKRFVVPSTLFSPNTIFFFSPRLVLYICYCLVAKALISTTILPIHLPLTINTRLLLSTIAAEDWQLVIAPFCFCFCVLGFFCAAYLGFCFACEEREGPIRLKLGLLEGVQGKVGKGWK